jgi:hypothetical protein
MNGKRFMRFATKVIVAHTVTYFVVGAVAYQWLTKQFYEGDHAVFASFMRTPAEPEIWRHVMQWFLPAQILRGFVLAAVLYPLFDTMAGWSRMKRFWTLAGLYLWIGFWAATTAAPGTIEGLVYNRPEITLCAHLTVQPEIVIQGLALAAWLARWMAPHCRSVEADLG